MTDDFVQRLSAGVVYVYEGNLPLVDEDATDTLMIDAAYEIKALENDLHHCFHRIEELQTALRAIIDRAEFRNSEYVTDAVCAIAREALGETK